MRNHIASIVHYLIVQVILTIPTHGLPSTEYANITHATSTILRTTSRTTTAATTTARATTPLRTTTTTPPPTTLPPTTKPPPKIRARLVEGNGPWEGRVEISLKGGPYGTVCDDGFNMPAAHVVCRMVGYKRAKQYFFGNGRFGPGTGEILFDNIFCHGTEKTILTCGYNPIGTHDCSHNEDIGVQCSQELIRVRPAKKKLKQYKFRLVGNATPYPLSEGVVEMYKSRKWRTICSDGWDLLDARVLCGSLGFKDAISVEPSPDNKSRQRKKTMFLTKIACTGQEHNVSDCERTEMKSYRECRTLRAAEARCVRGTHVMDVPKPATASAGNATLLQAETGGRRDVRLKAGARFGEGRLEVYFDGLWGTVCGEDFDEVSASVVCRQLGFGTVDTVYSDATVFGQGVGPIWLWDVLCKGTESSIFDCAHGKFNGSKCVHAGDVGIRCNVPDLGVSDKVQLVNGRFDTEGRVRVLIDGQWGHVCGSDWDMFDTMVVCRQLGLGYAHQLMRSTRYMGRSSDPILITDVRCTGNERSLQECPYTLMTNTTCYRNYMAGVLCTDALPDVLLDIHVLMSTTYLQDWPSYLLQCAWEEGCLSTEEDRGGLRRLLRFSSAIMNRGTANFRPVLGRHNWEWHSCHMHYHSMEVFSHYDLLDHEGNRVAEGHKASFCLEDVYCDSGAEKVYVCEGHGDQGISVNCVDIYRNNIDCQWIDITRIPIGSYVLRIDINPDRIVGETDFTNNVVVCDLYVHISRSRITHCRYADDA